ncbi:MAG: hypothetical protein AAFV53_34345 [Myxococcota bacterium]
MILKPLPLLLLFGAFFVACDDPADDDDNNDDLPGLDTDANQDDEYDGESPIVSNVDAWCYVVTQGASAWYWSVTATAEDPQGTDTLVSGSGSTVTVYAGPNEVYTQNMACTDDGDCLTSWPMDSSGMRCDASTASDYVFEVVIADEDDNVSEAATSAGRRGTDASG